MPYSCFADTLEIKLRFIVFCVIDCLNIAMIVEAKDGKTDSCLCKTTNDYPDDWIQCTKKDCSSPWWHQSCVGVSFFTKEQIEKFDFVCALCTLSDIKFSNHFKVKPDNDQTISSSTQSSVPADAPESSAAQVNDPGVTVAATQPSNEIPAKVHHTAATQTSNEIQAKVHHTATVAATQTSNEIHANVNNNINNSLSQPAVNIYEGNTQNKPICPFLKKGEMSPWKKWT